MSPTNENGNRVCSDECVHHLFEAQAVRSPDETAIVIGDDRLTYRDLDKRSARLANHLRNLGVGPGVLVGLYIGRSSDMIAALLGILRAGGAYVPLDPEYPNERIAYMIEDSGTKVLVSTDRLAGNLPDRNTTVVRMDTDADIIDRQDDVPPDSGVTPDNMIYVIYTSGSTGKPKGASVFHRGFVNLLKWYCEDFQFGPQSRTLLMTSLSFDLTQKNLYAPLTTGGRLVLVPSDFYDAGLILNCIEKHKIDVVNCTPSAFTGLLNDLDDEIAGKLSTLKHVFLGGEPIPIARLRPWLDRPNCRAEIVNTYGPTECTDVVAFYRLHDYDRYAESSVPIGKAIPNVELLILDDQQRIAPEGRDGELCIGGVCVGGGYLNRKELTEEKFIAHPSPEKAGETVYRTGDRARLMPDGNLEYLGREDHQVKIRGVRVEVGEIENTLDDLPPIQEAAVMGKADAAGEMQLVAYIVRKKGSEAKVGEIREMLKKRLPDNMLPTVWVFLDEMPLTPNGKIDRLALPAPSRTRPDLDQPFVPASTPFERFLSELWCEILQIDRVGVHDRFFEIGGTSLQAIRFMSRIGKTLGETVPITAFFEDPTIAGFIRHLETEYTDAVERRFGKTVDDRSVMQAEKKVKAAKARRPVQGVRQEDIAVIGLACRLPGANNADEFWNNLRNGVESIVPLTDEDLLANGVDPEALEDPNFVKATACMEDVENFDASFFGYTPRDAEFLDPQHRAFLECAWSALEHAGYNPDTYDGAVGVFGGVARNGYLINNIVSHPDLRKAAAEYYILIANEKDFPATRVSYKLNLKGPSVNVQTACSSSGVAVHLACQSLMSGDSDMALAGGCRVIVPSRTGYWYAEGGTVSPDGHVRAFDAKAQGMVRGSGIAVVVLKRLESALTDGDTIYSVIKGSAVNNDGADKAGYTAPSVSGQHKAVSEALRRAGVPAESISYVEAHGTATVIGDPIEFTALNKAFREHTDKKGFCALGSVKTNIGHLDAGSGVAGLIKTTLSLMHKELPPSLHYESPNPHISFDDSPFFVNAALREWKSENGPLRAGVSTFGLGGTNVHIVLEEAPQAEPSGEAGPWSLLTLSARSESALDKAADNLADYLEAHPETNIADAAYTLQVGRKDFEHRRILVCKDVPDAVETIRSKDAKRIVTHKATGTTPSIVFMFPGQGAQHAHMGRELYESEPLFKEIVDDCSEILKPILDVDLREILYPNGGDEAQSAEALKQTVITQPALFAVEYALARLWMSWGVVPRAMIGHSVGEYVAACLSGVFSMEDAVTLLSARSRLMQEQPPGSMLAVRLPEEQMQTYLGDGVSLAAVNAPNLSVVSGPPEGVAALRERLDGERIAARPLHTSHAFHSAMMDPVLEPFTRQVEKTTRNSPRIPFISSATGAWITDGQAVDQHYWAYQLRQAVRFSPGIRELRKEPGRVFLEVGPSKTLSTLVRQHADQNGPVTVVASLRHAQESTPDGAAILSALGTLWMNGYPADWELLYEGKQRRRIALPTYPFERKRYWIEPARITESEAAEAQPAFSAAQAEPLAEQGAPAAEEAPVDRRERILQKLKSTLNGLSGIPTAEMEASTSFLDMGFDSLFLSQVSLGFQKQFGTKITLRMLLDELSSLDLLAGYLDKQLPEDTAEGEAEAAPQAVEAKQAESAVSPKTVDVTRPDIEAFGPYKPYRKQQADELTPTQRAHLDDLIRRYTDRTGGSKALTQKHRAHFADPRAVAGFQLLWKEITYPIVSKRSSGSRIWDVDGNESIDMTMGFGSCLFGHRPPFIMKAVEAQLERGFEIGPQSEIAGEVAEKTLRVHRDGPRDLLQHGFRSRSGGLKGPRARSPAETKWPCSPGPTTASTTRSWFGPWERGTGGGPFLSRRGSHRKWSKTCWSPTTGTPRHWTSSESTPTNWPR